MSNLLNPGSAATAAPAAAARRTWSGWGKTTAWAGGAVAAVAAGAVAGLWFLPFAAGLAVGLVSVRRRRRVILPATGILAAVSWVLPLAWQAGHGLPVTGTARTAAALAGLPASAALVIAVTMLVAVVQAMLGAWLGRTIGGWPRRS